MKNVLILGALSIVAVSCGSSSDEFSSTMGITVASESLKSDAELFNYLSTKKSVSDCRLSLYKTGGSEASSLETPNSYELATELPKTAGHSISDWNRVFIESNFKMNLIHENVGYASSIKINRDSGGNESLDFVINTQAVVEQDGIFRPVPTRTGAGKILRRSSGKLLFGADGILKSINVKRETLKKNLLGNRWTLQDSVVETSSARSPCIPRWPIRP